MSLPVPSVRDGIADENEVERLVWAGGYLREDRLVLVCPPVAAEIRVPAKEVVAPKADAVPEAKVPEVKSVEIAVPAAPAAQPAAAVEVKVPEAKSVEIAVPAAPTAQPAAVEMKVPEVKPVEVSVPATPAAPEVQPVKTPEIKVPAIVLDPM